jgi:hypothetical protein
MFVDRSGDVPKYRPTRRFKQALNESLHADRAGRRLQ